MKKFLAILLALALVVSCFAACGSNTNTSSASGESSSTGDSSTAADDGSSAEEEDTATNSGDLPTISLMIVCIMCPTMSLIATLLFKEPSFGTWVQTWGLNMPMALIWQLLFSGPLTRVIFRALFRNRTAAAVPQG